MKKHSIFHTPTLVALFALFTFVSCAQQPPMSIHWEMGKNDVKPGICELYYTITNLSNKPITNEGWALYFNYMSLHPIYTEGDQILQTELQASYHSITPTEDFQPLMPDSSRTFKLLFKGNAIRQTSRPEGFFFINTKHSTFNPKPISIPCTYAPYTRPEQMKRGIVTWEKTPYADGEYVFDYVEGVLGERREAKGERVPHVAIWCSAILFSAIHMQFYGFVPRMLMGALFGYMLVWTGSLWVPILMHFTNNVMAVLVYYFVQRAGWDMEQMNAIGTNDTLWLGVASMVITIVGIYAFRRSTTMSRASSRMSSGS